MHRKLCTEERCEDGVRLFSACVWLYMKCISRTPSWGFMCPRLGTAALFEVKRSVIWDITSCSPVKVDRCFGGTYRLHFEGWGISQARKPPGSRQHAEPFQLIFNGLRDVISQKIELFLYLVLFICLFPDRWCLHFIVVVGCECSWDPESYAGGSVAAGRVTHAGQVKDYEPDEEGYPGPSVWGLGVRLTTKQSASE
jgi:hypothetical protein